MSEDPRFDPTVLDRLERKVGPQVLRQIIGLFCEQSPGRLRLFEEHRRSGDLAASAEDLHSIKGSAGMLGVRRLETLTRRMEQMARHGDGAGLTALVADLETAYAEALAFLRQRREELG